MKRKISIWLGLVWAIVFLVGCGSNQKNIQTVVESYFDSLTSGNFDDTQQYLNEKYDYTENDYLDINDIEILKKYYAMFNVEYISAEINNDTAVAKLSITHPDIQELLAAKIGAFSFGMADNAMEKAFEEKLDDSDLSILTDDAYLTLKKKQKNWEIITDANFTFLLFCGKTGEFDTTVVTENEKKLEETEAYIKENVQLVDYTVKECEGYQGTVPGIKDISIKNNGDKTIDSLEIVLDFVDEKGTIVFTQELSILGISDDSIKPGYSWKMKDDEFYEIEGLPDSVNINRVKVSIGEVTFAENSDISEEIEDTKSEEDKYIENYVSLENYKVSMCNGYLGTVPGLSNLSLKNNGNKNIKELTVTVYFQDAQGKNIAENSFLVIGGIFGGDTLKANYSWKMNENEFYEIENLADEVNISRYSVKVTGIAFE